MAVDVKGSFERNVSFAWFLLKKFLNFINPVEWLICFQYPIKGVLSVLGNATLGWYLVGGVVVCGGLGIIFTLFKVNFEWGDKAVLDSIIIFIATIIGGALFDLVFNLIKPDVSNKIPSFVAIEMIVLAMVMLLFAAKLYFMPMLTDVSRDNSKTVSTYVLFALSLCYWLVINAEDSRFRNKGDLSSDGMGGPEHDLKETPATSSELNLSGKEDE